VASQFFADIELGAKHRGYRCENLEHQTFEDETFDLVITLDVMEHVNRPDLAFREIARTLELGGAYLFTVPTYKERTESVRRAMFHGDTIEHL
jgi:2-polyprenyl-3-methyl-5-hydroxy-6-metoxy-1,4-benzoquinol methylase